MYSLGIDSDLVIVVTSTRLPISLTIVAVPKVSALEGARVDCIRKHLLTCKGAGYCVTTLY